MNPTEFHGLIQDWRAQARASARYAVQYAVTRPHEHHAAAGEAMGIAKCADELEAILAVEPPRDEDL